MHRFLALALVTLALASCKSVGSAVSGELDFADDAETNLKRGNDALEAKNYPDAERYYEYVKTKYPFLDAAKTAELHIADSNFAREQWTEARDQYVNFIKLHPLHPKVDYAAFRAALTHYNEKASDFFLLPPSEEKDQVEIKAALKAMGDFAKQYPKSEHLEESKKVAEDCKRRLVQHELYVARFYAKRERWSAVAARLEGVVKTYDAMPLQAEAASLLFDAYGHLNAASKGKELLRQMIDRFPGTDAAARALNLLKT
jgi:outer membrane protein assembly factor BamD